MNILYRNVPYSVYSIITDMVCKLSKEKKRKVSQSEAITTLLKNTTFALKENKKDNDGN